MDELLEQFRAKLESRNATDSGRVNLSTIIASDGKCYLDGCDKKFVARGMCSGHYQRWRKGADVISQKDADVEAKFWARVTKGNDDECWEWTGTMTELKYGFMYIKTKKIYAHRYSYWLHHGKWPEPMCLHHCDNPSCVNPAHLYEGTHQENMRDRDVRGRGSKLRGSQIGTSKLTESQVRHIKLLCNDRHNRQFLKETYKVSDAAISDIRLGKRWRHVKI